MTIGATNSHRLGVSWPPLLVAAATCWVVSVVVDLILIVALGYTMQLVRIAPMSGLDMADVYDSNLVVAADTERFRQELAPVVAGLSTTEAKVLAILEWTMNQVPRVGNQSARSSWRRVEIGRAGGGFTCGGMASIFHDALIASGIPARRVVLHRNLFDVYDSHVTVEAFVEEKWRVYDPTFHIALKVDGSRLGIHEARTRLYTQKHPNIEYEFLGEVKYPARTTTYPVSYETNLNNVYVELNRGAGVLRAIPLFGVWLAPELAYEAVVPGLGTMAQDFYRFLYWMAMVVLPVINLLLLLGLWLAWRKARTSHA